MILVDNDNLRVAVNLSLTNFDAYTVSDLIIIHLDIITVYARRFK